MSKTLVDVISRVLAAIIAALLLLRFGLAAAEMQTGEEPAHDTTQHR